MKGNDPHTQFFASLLVELWFELTSIPIFVSFAVYILVNVKMFTNLMRESCSCYFRLCDSNADWCVKGSWNATLRSGCWQIKTCSWSWDWWSGEWFRVHVSLPTFGHKINFWPQEVNVHILAKCPINAFNTEWSNSGLPDRTSPETILLLSRCMGFLR